MPSKCLFVFKMVNMVFLRETIRQDLCQMVVTCFGLRHIFAWGAHPLPRQELYLETLMFSKVLTGFQRSHKQVQVSLTFPAPLTVITSKEEAEGLGGFLSLSTSPG